MMRSLPALLIAVTAVGVVATPGLAAVGLLLIPLAVLVAIGWMAVAAATRGHRAEVLVRVRRTELLGPGVPDDPFTEGETAPASPSVVEERRVRPTQKSPPE